MSITLSSLEWLSELFNNMKDRAVSLQQLSFLLIVGFIRYSAYTWGGISYHEHVKLENCTNCLRYDGVIFKGFVWASAYSHLFGHLIGATHKSLCHDVIACRSNSGARGRFPPGDWSSLLSPCRPGCRHPRRLDRMPNLISAVTNSRENSNSRQRRKEHPMLT